MAFRKEAEGYQKVPAFVPSLFHKEERQQNLSTQLQPIMNQSSRIGFRDILAETNPLDYVHWIGGEKTAVRHQPLTPEGISLQALALHPELFRIPAQHKGQKKPGKPECC